MRAVSLLLLLTLATPALAGDAIATLRGGLDADARDDLQAAREAYQAVAQGGGPLAAHARLRLCWTRLAPAEGALPAADALTSARLEVRALREDATARGDALLENAAQRILGVVTLVERLREVETVAATETVRWSEWEALVRAHQALRDERVALADREPSDPAALATNERAQRDALLTMQAHLNRDLGDLGSEPSEGPGLWRHARLSVIRRMKWVMDERLRFKAVTDAEVAAWERSATEAEQSARWGSLGSALAALITGGAPKANPFPQDGGYEAALVDLGFARDDVERRLRAARLAWDLREQHRVRALTAQWHAQAADELLAARATLRHGGQAVDALRSLRSATLAILGGRDRDLAHELLDLHARRSAFAPPG
jgi:hypothetical protein